MFFVCRKCRNEWEITKIAVKVFDEFEIVSPKAIKEKN